MGKTYKQTLLDTYIYSRINERHSGGTPHALKAAFSCMMDALATERVLEHLWPGLMINNRGRGNLIWVYACQVMSGQACTHSSVWRLTSRAALMLRICSGAGADPHQNPGSGLDFLLSNQAEGLRRIDQPGTARRVPTGMLMPCFYRQSMSPSCP